MSNMKAAVRCNALDMSALARQEEHGKRQDSLSQKRRVRDVGPLMMSKGGLDLRRLYDAHVDGAKVNAALKKPVLHFIVRFPPELLGGQEVGRFRGDKAARHQEMARQARDFINATHGGNAVFALRLDRDEEGETIVDVFAAPKYEKRTKRTQADKPGSIWISPTKFGKELAEKHSEEIHRRHPKAQGSLTKPRHVGIALQSEFATFFRARNGVSLAPKVEKKTARKDRIEKEAHDELETKRKELAIREQQAAARLHQLETDEESLRVAKEDLAKERRALHVERRALDRIKSRVVGLVRSFGETFGLPLSKCLHDAVSDLEDEMMRQSSETLEDPFSAASEEPLEESAPGF